MSLFLNFKWLFITITICFLIYFVYDYLRLKLSVEKDIHFKDKDVEVVSEAFKKIGEVSQSATTDQMILNLQNVENNKEIHSLNKKIEEFNKRLDDIYGRK